MSRLTKQLKSFNKGMTPFINQDDGIARLEHFDITTDQLRPFRGLIASTYTDYEWLSKFVMANNRLYALARSNAAPNHMTILRWNQTTFSWELYQSINDVGVAADVLHFYDGHFIGLWKGTHLWRITSGSIDPTFAARTYNYTADFITHSKDGLCYIPTDNILNVFNGTNLTTGITFPTNYRITSIAEQGDYINVVGYDTVSGKSTSYLWDRDSSLTTLTAKYDLGFENVFHNANLGGTTFSISLKANSSNSNFDEKPRLIIRYLSGDKFKVIDGRGEFQFKALSIGGKYVDNNKLYFNAYIITLTESVGHWCVFQLDEQGRLSIVQNVGINDEAGSLAEHPGIIRDGDGFWIGGRQDGSWNTTNNYNTQSIIEINPYESKFLNKNIDTVGLTLSFEPLPAGSSVTILTRADEETDWTEIGVFDTDNQVKGSIPAADLVSTAKTRQIRIESLGGATINGIQSDFEEKDDEEYN